MMAGGYITLQGRANDPDGDPIIGWHWELDAWGDGNPPSIAGAATPNPTFAAESPGLYVVTLVVDNGVESSEPDFAIITVADNRQPVAVAEADQTSGPSPLTVNFNGIESTEPDFQPLTYSWSFGDGTTEEGPRVTHLYSIPGTYLVTLLATDDHGAVDLDTLEITVTENDIPPVVDVVPVQKILADEDAAPEDSAAAEIGVAETGTSRVADVAAVGDALMDEVAATENASTTDQMPDSVQFGATGYSVDEEGATALVWVTRTGNNTNPISVGYATDDFTATAGSDYIATSGTLNFAEGVVVQPVRVPILNDSEREKNESFVLFLYNVTGRVSLEARRVAFVNIVDNDVVDPDQASVAHPEQTPDLVPVSDIVENTQCATTSNSAFKQRERYREINVAWTVNLFSSTDRANVDALATKAESLNIPAVIKEAVIDGTRYWRLQVTGFNSRSDAEENSVIIKEKLGIDKVWIFPEKQSGNTVARCPSRKGDARGG